MNQDKTNPTREKILIVDDVPENLDVLRQALDEEGYDLLFALNGEDALRIAAGATPELILLDVIMPGMDGFEVCRRLKKNQSTQDIPVIFITFKDKTEDVIEGFRVGGVDYITKPPEKEEVLARVETHLTNARLTKALRQKNTELTEALEKLQQQIAKREQAEDALKTADEHLSMISQQEAERWGIAGFVAQSKTMAAISEICHLTCNRNSCVCCKMVSLYLWGQQMASMSMSESWLQPTLTSRPGWRKEPFAMIYTIVWTLLLSMCRPCANAQKIFPCWLPTFSTCCLPK